MLPILRLSTNALAGRRNRTLLLIAAVALSATLVAAVSAALESLNTGMKQQAERSLGRADLRVQEVGEQPFDASVLELVRADPAIVLAAPRVDEAFPVINPETGAEATAVARGIVPELEYALRDPSVSRGRAVQADDEIVVSEALADQLGLSIGDVIEEAWLGEPRLTVVGIAASSRLEFVRAPEAVTTVAAVEAATGESGTVTQIRIVLAEGEDPFEVADRLSERMPRGVQVEPTERITTGIRDNVRANTFFFRIASALAFIAAGFIVLTGLTTSVLERQKELAIMRCVGAGRIQLAGAQFGVGAFIGLAGAALGVPLGVALAWALAALFPERLPAGLHISWNGLVVTAAGSVVAGVVGAAYPAINAARSRPLAAMRSRSKPARARGVILCAVVGLACVASQLLLITSTNDSDFVFWSYAYLGLPLMFLGYFLLGVPIVVLVARTAGPLIARAFRLPRGLLESTAASTPYRNGFTAGALMVGLAMMTSIWTNGNAILNDWLAKMDFPEAFARGWLGIDEDARDRIESLGFVPEGGTVLITELRIETEAFGVSDFRGFKTSFIAFEPEPFFDMVSLDFVAGDPEVARRKLEQGGAVIVAQEFLVHRPQYGIGETFEITHDGRTHSFEIVGAVVSPGLDLVSKYFNVGKNQADAAIHSVFGSRADLKEKFGTDAIDFVMIDLDGTVSDEVATREIRALFENTAMVVGSGQEIKDSIAEIARGSMRVASAVAIASMLIGVLGVGNIVIAGIDARRFEMGVLRAVGAPGPLLAKEVIGEVLIVAITAGVLGTALGLQGAYAGQRIWELIAGIRVGFGVPVVPIAIGWAALIALTVAMVVPIVVSLSRAKPRELLFSTRG